MQRISFSRFYPRLKESRHPVISDDSLQFYEWDIADTADINRLFVEPAEKKGSVKQRPHHVKS
jgi:hypothetical protein